MATSRLLLALFRPSAAQGPLGLLAGARGALSALLADASSRFPFPPAAAAELQIATPYGALTLPRGASAASAAASVEEDGEDGAPATSWWKRVSSLEVFQDSIWFAVPKRKKSYARKRQRQMNPLYGAHDINHFYPCPKCTKGYVKLRHHLCPCDQEKLGFMGIKKVVYASMKGKAEAPAAAAAGTTSAPATARST